MDIAEIIEKLESAPRSGADVDEPEGVRYILISDTCVKEMVKCLKDCGTYFRIPRSADGKYDWVENISEDSGEDGIIHPWG